ncbi:hypothetical protein KNHN1_13940 [Pseudomonas guariconensis]
MLDNVWFLLQRAQKPRQLAAVAFAHLRVAQDQWVSPEFVKRYLFMGKQLVADRHGDHQWVVPDRFGAYAIANIGGVREPYREIAGPQSAQLFGQRDLGQPNFNLWLILATMSKERRQPLIDCTIGYGDAQATLLACRDGPDVFSGLVQNGEEPADILQKGNACRCQPGSTPIPVEEDGPQFVFQLLDGSGQRRLLDMQPFGGSGEMQLLGQCRKATKMSQLHVEHASRIVW